MEPERRKEIIYTAIIAAVFILVGLLVLDQLIGDPMALDQATDKGY